MQIYSIYFSDSQTVTRASYNKALPLLPSSKSDNAWKKLITLWTNLTILANKAKQSKLKMQR